VTEFLKAKEDPFKLKTWINTVLGETFEERGDSVDPTSLAARVERYPAEVPNGVGVLVVAVDVQGDRLEVFVKGYGAPRSPGSSPTPRSTGTRRRTRPGSIWTSS